MRYSNQLAVLQEGSRERFRLTLRILDQPRVLLFFTHPHFGLIILFKEHMHGENWLNVSKFPTIEFSVQPTRIKKENHSISAIADGKMTIRNVTIKMSTPVDDLLGRNVRKRNKNQVIY